MKSSMCTKEKGFGKFMTVDNTITYQDQWRCIRDQIPRQPLLFPLIIQHYCSNIDMLSPTEFLPLLPQGVLIIAN